MLGMLYRQFSNHSSEPAMIRLYLTLVRPVLEYGAEVWHLHLIKDIQALKVAGYHFNEIHDFASGYLSICADGVAVCALFVYR